MQEDYYSRKEVSNSDLSWLKQQLWPRQVIDPTQAYKFGSLIDAMITEPERVNYYKYTVGDVMYTKEQFDLAVMMKKAVYKDPQLMSLISVSNGQEEMSRDMEINYGGLFFFLSVRCKWDLWAGAWGWGGDIKSTTAKTQKEFEAAAIHFNYDRQRAWYMDIAQTDRDVLIGISKANQKIFKIFINKGDEFYSSGKEKYTELAFRWWLLFGHNRPAAA